jgi:hypothetical protein
MGRKGLFAALAAVGLSLVALSVFADAIGIGAGDYSFGWEQKLGVAVGMTVVWLSALCLVGRYPLRQRTGGSGADSRHGAPASA